MPRSLSTSTPRVVVIGTGFGGLGVAIELLQHGLDDLVILERADEVGGVWRENTYPGAACDVPSPYYSYSFEPNAAWPRRFSQQPAILEYLKGVADSYGLRGRIRFGTEVTGADWDDAAGRWTVHTTTADGPADLEADVLVSAVGQLSRPVLPRIEGIGTFAGPAFHSAQWDHTVDLTGKRVAVIGTGASAIQFVPEIQPQVASLALFQRTPPYILPRPDTEFSAARRRLFERVPLTQGAERAGWYAAMELLGTAFLYAKPLAKFFETACRVNLRRQVKDPALRAKLWPDYPIGCKRLLFSSNYLPAVAQPNVDVVTDRIEAITPAGVRTADGREHEVDVIIYGTGFAATDFLAPMEIRGPGGRSLQEQWSAGARAYLGISVPNFPNLFLVYGPNTNTGSGSIVAFEEAQAGYIRQAVEHVAATGAAIAVREDVEREFDETLQGRLVDGVWSACSSWYRDASGRISANWPGLVTEYRRRTARFRPGDYERITAPVPAEAEPAA